MTETIKIHFTSGHVKEFRGEWEGGHGTRWNRYVKEDGGKLCANKDLTEYIETFDDAPVYHFVSGFQPADYMGGTDGRH